MPYYPDYIYDTYVDGYHAQEIIQTVELPSNVLNTDYPLLNKIATAGTYNSKSRQSKEFLAYADSTNKGLVISKGYYTLSEAPKTMVPNKSGQGCETLGSSLFLADIVGNGHAVEDDPKLGGFGTVALYKYIEAKVYTVNTVYSEDADFPRIPSICIPFTAAGKSYTCTWIYYGQQSYGDGPDLEPEWYRDGSYSYYERNGYWPYPYDPEYGPYDFSQEMVDEYEETGEWPQYPGTEYSCYVGYHNVMVPFIQEAGSFTECPAGNRALGRNLIEMSNGLIDYFSIPDNADNGANNNSEDRASSLTMGSVYNAHTQTLLGEDPRLYIQMYADKSYAMGGTSGGGGYITTHEVSVYCTYNSRWYSPEDPGDVRATIPGTSFTSSWRRYDDDDPLYGYDKEGIYYLETTNGGIGVPPDNGLYSIILTVVDKRTYSYKPDVDYVILDDYTLGTDYLRIHPDGCKYPCPVSSVANRLIAGSIDRKGQHVPVETGLEIQKNGSAVSSTIDTETRKLDMSFLMNYKFNDSDLPAGYRSVSYEVNYRAVSDKGNWRTNREYSTSKDWYRFSNYTEPGSTKIADPIYFSDDETEMHITVDVRGEFQKEDYRIETYYARFFYSVKFPED